jgi:ligand-binding sensor domain-containing protein
MNLNKDIENVWWRRDAPACGVSASECHIPQTACRAGLFLVIFVCLSFPQSLLAQKQTIPQMVHTSWTGRDGAPQEINALAQTPDGTLWIGSTGGLFSFDGITFAYFQPMPWGSLFAIERHRISPRFKEWRSLGRRNVRLHSAARISHGHVTVYDRIDDEHVDKLTNLQQDSQGIMWAVIDDRQLVRLGDDNVWHIRQNPTNSNQGFIGGLFIDSTDTQWVLEDQELYRRPKGEERFSATSIRAKYNVHFIEDSGHGIWVIGQPYYADVQLHAAARILDSKSSQVRRLPNPINFWPINDMLGTPDGDLWLAIDGRGLIRLPHEEVEKYPSLKSDATLDMYSVKNVSPQIVRQLCFGILTAMFGLADHEVLIDSPHHI